jgi:UDP-N-acetylmuramoyl-L-alanyl-D-glutamate--2,6-diaminopimelate ligase
MLLGELIQGLGIRPADAAHQGVRICDITEDSRTVMPGSLFIARPGLKSDGRAYIHQAIAADAAAILTDPATPPTPQAIAAGTAWLVTEDIPLAESWLAERFYGNPSRTLTMIGATGTNGKTTITYLIYELLRAAGTPCGLIGTVTIDDGTPAQASMTTPPALEISFTLARMIESGYRACSMEVSSHSLDQKRVAALDFDIAIFTNLTGDHLDYHGTMASYIAAKAKLFSALRPDALAIVNADDPAHADMLRDCRARVIRCSLSPGTAAECCASAGPMTLEGTPLTLEGPWGTIEGSVRLIGTYNVMNVLQAVAAAHAAGASRDDIALALHTLTAPPGRLEMVTRDPHTPEPFGVFVDYAHTDDALAKALTAVRPLADQTGGKLRVVFGCGGDRDRTKRPRMARAACTLADLVYITSDNPRTESPSAIIREIMSGVPDPGSPDVHIDADRRTAITRAINDAAAGDVVLIAGKGHEDYQLVSDGAGGIKRLDFDDRLVAREALQERANRTEAAAT